MAMTLRIDRVRALPIVALLVWGACSSHGASAVGADGGDAAAPAVAIGGTVRGLIGSGLVLALGDERLAITADGAFAFARPVARGARYDVAVSAQPAGPTQRCTVDHGSGTAGSVGVTDVEVACSTSAFTVGGTVEGLAGTGLMLRSASGEMLAVTGSSFRFATAVESGGHYEVEIAAQPTAPAQTCVLSHGSGDVADADITDVAIVCETQRFAIRGSIAGLTGSGLRLRNNGGDEIAASGTTFAFPTAVLSGAGYSVTVAQQPSGPLQTCTVSAGAGTVGAGDVTSVTVNCGPRTFTIGGTTSGLAGSGFVLQDNFADDLAVNGNGAFAFATPIATGDPYAVTVKTQPINPAQVCTVTNGSGQVMSANISQIQVRCVTSAFPVGGSVSGLAPGNTLTLLDNGGDALAVTANGAFVFGRLVGNGQSYTVTVASVTGATAQRCVVANGTGTVSDASVSSVVVTCTAR
ncbi:MAG TPA: hypothetical protein VFP84_30910 [Kofleriaceae bacterium]|nr:hypothetical protein [Kofleriaceae bacterium]